jgi:D-alanine-D-alanine ligase
MAEPERVRLVVLFGGQSAEHEVSCATAFHVLQVADPDRYVLDPVGITREGSWVRADEARTALASGVAALEAVAPQGALRVTGTAVDPLPTVRPAAAGDLPVVVLPLLHGTKGEDGTVQGMLELAGVPYVGSGVLGSALAMHKVKAKQLAEQAGLPQCRWLALRDTETADAHRRVAAAELTYPLFVKPANLGSSVGVSKVASSHELGDAISLAAAYDEWVVVEEGVDGREIEVAVLGHNASPRASLPGEILTSREFYDYEDKYVSGRSEQIIPADLSPEVTAEIRALACTAFTALDCDGMARVDFFYEERGRGLLLNEVNTIPGFTPISMFPMLWEATGLPYRQLVDELVRLAVERHDRRSRFSTKR